MLFVYNAMRFITKSTPQRSTPQESTPQKSTPQKSTPQKSPKDRTPEIDTSEIIVDVQWHVPMDSSGMFKRNVTFQQYAQKDCHLSSGFLLELSNGFVQWGVPAEFHFCDFRCVIFCPDPGEHQRKGIHVQPARRAERDPRAARAQGARLRGADPFSAVLINDKLENIKTTNLLPRPSGRRPAGAGPGRWCPPPGRGARPSGACLTYARARRVVLLHV